jgi:hypothetical protein
MLRRLLSTIVLVNLLTACYGKPPAPVAPRSATVVNTSQTRTWDAVIDVFAERNIPIKNMDRSSGFIATDPLGTRGAKAAWYDCGTDMMQAPVSSNLATYTVLVRGDSTKSTVKATVRYTTLGENNAVVECSSKGIWEHTFEDDVKVRAEGGTK